jgi:serine protease Do
VIGAVDPSSDAAGKGIQRGDVITSVNQQPVASAADVAAVVTAARTAGRGSVLAFVQRGAGRALPVPLKLKAK